MRGESRQSRSPMKGPNFLFVRKFFLVSRSHTLGQLESKASQKFFSIFLVTPERYFSDSAVPFWASLRWSKSTIQFWAKLETEIVDLFGVYSRAFSTHFTAGRRFCEREIFGGAKIEAFCRNYGFGTRFKGFLGGVGLRSSSQRIIVDTVHFDDYVILEQNVWAIHFGYG